MANIKSAKKRILQSNKRRILNKSVRSETRTEIKKFLSMIQKSADTQELETQLQYVEKVLDKAAGKGVIHKNKAARVKSRLRIRVNAIKTPTPSTQEASVQ